MDKSLINTNIEQQFTEVVNLIVQHRSKASMAVNKEMLLTAWHVGAYVSKKLKSEEWGSKVISQLSEYIRSQHPEIKGHWLSWGQTRPQTAGRAEVAAMI